jgi:rubredoxin
MFLRGSGVTHSGGLNLGALDYSEKVGKDLKCPECEKHKKHVKLVETDGKTYECPECHYIHLARR